MKFIVVISGPSIVLSSEGKWLPSGCMLGRVERTLELWEELSLLYSDLYIITSGWDGDGARDIPSSTIMKNYLVDHGVPDFRVLEDRLARSTIENAIYSFALMKQCERNCGLMRVARDDYYTGDFANTFLSLGPVTNIWLVTSEFHMKRSKMIFDKYLKISQLEAKINYISSDNKVGEDELKKLLTKEEQIIAHLQM